jgi:hypothetical protein
MSSFPEPRAVCAPQAYVYLSLQLLVTACPCALILSTPVTVCRYAPGSRMLGTYKCVLCMRTLPRNRALCSMLQRF